jgi:hypothetical protein
LGLDFFVYQPFLALRAGRNTFTIKRFCDGLEGKKWVNGEMWAKYLKYIFNFLVG